MRFDMDDILSPREQEFFKKLKDQEKVTIDELVDLVKEKEDKDIKRQNAIVCVKYLQAKIANWGWVISRVSKLGAGNTGVYSMSEKF